MTKLPDDGVVGVTVSVIGVLLMVLLIDPVVVGPVVDVSGTVDDVGCDDSVVPVMGVDSVTDSVQTYVKYTLIKCFVSFVQRFVVFRKLQRMISILLLKYQRCPFLPIHQYSY